MITRQAFRPLTAAATRQWVCPTCSVGIPSTQSSRLSQQKRSLYSRPRLNFDEHFAADGVKGLYSSQGYRLAWIEYQNMLGAKLSQLLAGKSIDGKDVKDLTIRMAHNPATAAIFNHASMAHNNHLFFQQFSTTPQPLEKYPVLHGSLVEHFGSIEAFRKAFIDTALGMFGPGFVWLVWARDPDNLSGARDGSWKILCTYNAGTPYPEAGFMQQGLDMNTNDQASLTQYKQSSIGSFGQYSAIAKDKAQLPPGGTTIMPMLCVSVHQHSYILDFGLPGKHSFLDSFFDVIDWQVVKARAPKEVGPARNRSSRLGGA